MQLDEEARRYVDVLVAMIRTAPGRLPFEVQKAVDAFLGVKPSNPPALIAGALIDFVSYLTTRPKVIKVGASETIYDMHKALSDWAFTRLLPLEGVAIENWRQRLDETMLSPSAAAEEVKEHLAELEQLGYASATKLRDLARLMPATIEPPPDLIGDVQAFGEKYGLPINQGAPHLLAPEDWGYRYNFLLEELQETLTAYHEGNLAETADGLIDLIYVAIGTLQLMAVPVAEGWREVQRANMTKERVAKAEDSKRGHAWDIRKPEAWQPPDWGRVLHQAAIRASVPPEGSEWPFKANLKSEGEA